MSEIYPLLDFLEFDILLPPLVFVELLAHHSVYPIIDRYLPHTFTLFTALLHVLTFCGFLCTDFTLFYCVMYIVISRRFVSLLNFHVHCRMLSLISYNVMVGWSVLGFLSLYVTLLIVFCYW